MKEHILAKKILLLAVCGSIAACLQIYQIHFIFWREDFWSEIWRWWTGHWVHVGWMHLLLNLLAFVCLPFIFPEIKNRFFIILMVLLPPAISLSFYYFYLDIVAYAGFSGVLHGLYAAFALSALQYPKERKFGLLVLVLIVGKIVWEIMMGSLGTSAIIGSPVLIEAHYLGVLWGTIFCLIYMAYVYFDLKAKIIKSEAES